MDIEILIEEVKNYPALYSQSDDKYRHVEFKERVWKKIATKLKAKGGVEECKRKWASIRDQLRRTIQKRKTVSGQSCRKYKYEDQLEFLLPHITERETISNIYNLDEGNGEEVSTQVNVEEDFIDDQMQVEEEPHEIPNRVHVLKQQQSFEVVRSVSLKRKTQRELVCEESPCSQLIAYILAEKEAKQKLARERLQTHPVDDFLAGIAPSLKSLNPILLNEAKTHIFSVVQEFELKQLTNSSGQYIIDQSLKHEPPSSPASRSSGSNSPLYQSPHVNSPLENPLYTD